MIAFINLKIAMWYFYSPVQFPICPLPVHPGLHIHVKLPIVFIHKPAGDDWQVSVPSVHSSISETIIRFEFQQQISERLKKMRFVIAQNIINMKN